MNKELIKHTVENYGIKDVGHVYVIEDKEKGIVKVGRSKNPRRRLRDIKRISCVNGNEYISHKRLGANSQEALQAFGLYTHLIKEKPLFRG